MNDTFNCVKNHAIFSEAEQKKLQSELQNTYSDNCGVNYLEGGNLPRRREILTIVENLQELMFPGYDERLFSQQKLSDFLEHALKELESNLFDQISRALRHKCVSNNCENCNVCDIAADTVRAALNFLPELRELLKLDVKAAFAGDPAAMSLDEVILSYPCIKTITIQRFAHLLQQKNVPLIPRMMTEYAHSLTGIDIHPGATIGKGFFIDHGTGVVIGETALIGDNVRIYQGVTLGALSFPKDACGMLVKGRKRHPTIQDNVIIYAGATVLGDIVIGEKSVIGGNVWVTESLPAGTKISAKL